MTAHTTRNVLATMGLCIVCWLFVVLLHVQAQTPPWSVWLLDNTTGDILRINQSGEVQDIHRIPAHDTLTIRRDKIAFTTRLNAIPALVIFSLKTDEAIATLSLPNPQMGFFNSDDQMGLTPMAFDEQASFLAYSYKLGGEGWALQVIDAQNGTIQHTLAWQDEAVKPYQMLHAGVVPLVQAVLTYNGVVDSVHFTIENDDSYPFANHRSYVWYPQTQVLYETVSYPTFSYATLLPSGDGLSALADSRFEASSKAFKFSFLQTNTVQVSVNNRRFPFYTNAELDIQRVFFVQNGQRVLITAYWDELNTIWVLLERSGDEVERYRKASDDVIGVSDGFVYLTTASDKTALVHVNTLDMTNAKTVWVKDGNWQLVGTDFEVLPFTDAWTALAPAKEAPTSANILATPTIYPTPLPLLRVGMNAQIQTEEDEYLNLRATPSTTGEVLSLLESGVQLVIVGGPVEADGYTWWQVRVGSREGWVVERVEEVQSLIPPQPIIEMTATPTSQP